MRYFLLRILLGWLARLGGWAHGVLARAEERHRIGCALEPGTPLRIKCDCCPPEKVWYVVRYNPGANDYTLSATWPPETGLAGQANRDWTYQQLNEQVEVLK